jgi:hypothetical protein
MATTSAQTMYAMEARSANKRGHHMEGSALNEQTAFGRCRHCRAELVIGDGKVSTRPDAICPGSTR